MFEDIHRTYEDGVKDGEDKFRNTVLKDFSDFVDDIIDKELLEIYKAYYEKAKEYNEVLGDNVELDKLLRKYKTKYGELK